MNRNETPLSFFSYIPAIAHNSKEIVQELRKLNENLEDMKE